MQDMFHELSILHKHKNTVNAYISLIKRMQVWYWPKDSETSNVLDWYNFEHELMGKKAQRF